MHVPSIVGRALTILCVGLAGCGEGSSGPAPTPTTPSVEGLLFGFDGEAEPALGSRIFLNQAQVPFLVVADDTSLAWIGFRASGVATFADSVPVAFVDRDSVIGLAVTLTPPPGIRGSLALRAFARNREGVLAEVDLAESPARIVPQSANNGSGGLLPAADRAYDLGGEGGAVRRYTADRDAARVVLTTGSLWLEHALPTPASGVDVTEDDSVLAVALPGLDAVGVLDRRLAGAGLRIIPDTISTEPGTPCRIVVLRSNQALVTRCQSLLSSNYALVDLASGTQTPLPGLVPFGGLARTLDRRLAWIWDTSGAPTRVQVYNSETRAIGNVVTLPWRSGPSSSANRQGTLLAMGQAVLSLPDLRELQRFRPPGSGMTLLSPDGATLLRFTSLGLLRMRRSDGLPHDLLLGAGESGQHATTPDGSIVESLAGQFMELPPLAPVINLRDGGYPAAATSEGTWMVDMVRRPCERTSCWIPLSSWRLAR